MTLEEMHIWFRQYAQQMGMQNVRAILPEQIDLLINTSISDIINQIIKENIGITNDRIITDNSKIGQINALKTLYSVKLIDLSPDNVGNKYMTFDRSDKYVGRITNNNENVDKDFDKFLYFVDASINYRKTKDNIGYTGLNKKTPYCKGKLLTPKDACSSDPNSQIGFIYDTGNDAIEINGVYDPITKDQYSDTFTIDISDANNIRLKLRNPRSDGYNYLGVQRLKGSLSDFVIIPTYRLTKDFEDGDETSDDGVLKNPFVVIQYRNSEYIKPLFTADSIVTNFFPIRLIEDSYLADTLNDFVLKNRLRSPIMVMYNMDEKVIFDIYIDEFKEHDTTEGVRYTLRNGLVPYQLRISYIAIPAKVEYKKDTGEENIECNLPEYLHIDILKHAVDLYRISISGNLQAAKQQEQSAQQENMRNNYRNEGNKQQ